MEYLHDRAFYVPSPGEYTFDQLRPLLEHRQIAGAEGNPYLAMRVAESVIDLGNAALARNDVGAYEQWGSYLHSRLFSLPESSLRINPDAKRRLPLIYDFAGAQAGHRQAAERLHGMLDINSRDLSVVIELCAYNRLPPDGWLARLEQPAERAAAWNEYARACQRAGYEPEPYQRAGAASMVTDVQCRRLEPIDTIQCGGTALRWARPGTDEKQGVFTEYCMALQDLRRNRPFIIQEVMSVLHFGQTLLDDPEIDIESQEFFVGHLAKVLDVWRLHPSVGMGFGEMAISLAVRQGADAVNVQAIAAAAATRHAGGATSRAMYEELLGYAAAQFATHGATSEAATMLRDISDVDVWSQAALAASRMADCALTSVGAVESVAQFERRQCIEALAGGRYAAAGVCLEGIANTFPSQSVTGKTTHFFSGCFTWLATAAPYVAGDTAYRSMESLDRVPPHIYRYSDLVRLLHRAGVREAPDVALAYAHRARVPIDYFRRYAAALAVGAYLS